MKKYLILLTVLLAGCNTVEKYTLSYFNFPINKNHEEVKKIMLSAGFSIMQESTSKAGIAFDNGKFLGYEVDCILMNFDSRNNLETIIMSIDNNANIFYDLSFNILKNNYGVPTTDSDTEQHKKHWWRVGDQKIILILKNEKAVYSVTSNPELFLHKE